jgi:DNA modification methylase
MGSGTTAIAALMNQRNYIGFEISKEYVEMAQNRISDFVAEQKQSLFSK